jgi:signal transduction histidine kinase
MVYRNLAGESRTLSVSATVARNQDNEEIAAVCVVRDVTDFRRAEEQIRQHNVYLAALHETSLGLMHQMEVKDLLEAVTTRAASLVNSAHGYIYLLDPSSQELAMNVGTGAFADKRGSRLRKGEGLAGTVWKEARSITVDDYYSWAGRSTRFEDIQFHSVVGVPLWSGREVVGVLGLAYLEQERTFDATALDILTRFAQLASIALDNARLYGAARQELAERQRAEDEVRNLNENLEVIVAQRTAELEFANRELQSEIAERQRAEAEKAQVLTSEQLARAEAEEAARAREALLSLVSHDLRNPLAAVRSTTRLVQHILGRSEGEVDGRVLAGLARIENSAQKMNRLIDELLDFGKLQAGLPLDLYRQDIDVVELARSVAANHQQYAERHEIVVESAVSELCGTWDSLRLERVLDNLVSNSIKYSPRGGRIVLSITREEAPAARRGENGRGWWACIRVHDDGIGIPPEDISSIFDWYHRASNVSGQIRGTGIGLSTVRQVVEQHGGSIAVKSIEGEGTDFTLLLPLEAPQAGPAQHASATG